MTDRKTEKKDRLDWIEDNRYPDGSRWRLVWEAWDGHYKCWDEYCVVGSEYKDEDVETKTVYDAAQTMNSLHDEEGLFWSTKKSVLTALKVARAAIRKCRREKRI